MEQLELVLDSTSDIELEKLLKLLEDTKPLDHNDSFVIFLKTMGVEKGNVLMKVEDIIRAYKKITVKKAIRVCAGFLDVIYIKAIPYFSINKSFTVPKKPTIYNEMKFEYFLEETNISIGKIRVKKEVFYNYYDQWSRITYKKIPLTKAEFFSAYKKYFNGKGLSRDLKEGDVTAWRKQRVKKEKA